MITISYGGNSYTFPNLTDHPFGYEEGDVRRGRSVRRWNVTGIVKPADALPITNIFDAWNAAKFLEDDPVRSGVVGATVAFTGSSPGYTWSTPIPCWFASPPALPLAGYYVRVSLGLVDATQSLAVLLRQGEEEAEQFDALGLGTRTFGGAVVNLTADPSDIIDLPSVNLSPGGKHIITGPLAPTDVERIQGWVSSAHKATLETWLKNTIATTPSTGSWFPIEWTQPVIRRRSNNGTIANYYDVSFTVVKKR
jgi:hypothetical protein